MRAPGVTGLWIVDVGELLVGKSFKLAVTVLLLHNGSIPQVTYPGKVVGFAYIPITVS